MSTITLEANSTPDDDYDDSTSLESGKVYHISIEATQTTCTGTSTTMPETVTTTTITYQTTISALIYRSAGCLGLSETSTTKDYRYEFTVTQDGNQKFFTIKNGKKYASAEGTDVKFTAESVTDACKWNIKKYKNNDTWTILSKDETKRWFCQLPSSPNLESTMLAPQNNIWNQWVIRPKS